MPKDTAAPDTIETTIIAYREAKTTEERRLFLRAALRKLEHDAALHAEHVRLLTVASAAEGQS